MPVVFVHGVPETAELWDGVRASIDRESVALSLPGFGNAAPDGFARTKEAYASWLREALDAIAGPIDLVGHDWGAILSTRVITTAPDRIRSWVVDSVANFDTAYVWHDLARLWQTPGDGEAFYDAFNAMTAEERIAGLVAVGIPEAFAPAMAVPDPEMQRSILALYRSATDVFGDWGDALAPTPMPGLVLLATNDGFGDLSLATAVADSLGARTERLDGLGHWWMLEDPPRVANTLERFWSSAD